MGALPLIAAALAVAGPPAVPAAGNSGNAAISGDGRYVALASDAFNLIRGDTNGVFDVFVRDRRTATTERVSIASDGSQANGRTGLSAITPDGRFVLMWSDASNLVPGDTNGVPDIFLRDRLTGTTERVSLGTGGRQADGDSALAAITPDGRFVAFSSTASNLGGDTPGAFDVFVRDRSTGTTEFVGDGWMPAMSADGRFVVYSRTRHFAEVVLRDRVNGTTELVSATRDGPPPDGPSQVPTISADGRFVAFVSEATNLVPGDTNGPGHRGGDVFVRDRAAATTERVSVAANGAQANNASGNPTISSDGRVVAFESAASNLGPALGGVFVRDLAARTTELVSVSTDGRTGDSSSYTGSGPLSADGRFVAFFSFASNLVPADANGAYDVFVRDRTARVTELVSAAHVPRLAAGALVLSPHRPRAGGSLAATLRVTVDGQRVATAAVGCAARVGGRKLTARPTFAGSNGRCVWGIPRGTRGRSVAGAVSVTTADGTVTRAFVVRIGTG